MNNKLICPFCNSELERDYDKIQCPDINCRHKHDWYGSYDLWQELIRTRKALEIAVDALKSAQRYICSDKKSYQIIQTAVEQITALEQKD